MVSNTHTTGSRDQRRHDNQRFVFVLWLFQLSFLYFSYIFQHRLYRQDVSQSKEDDSISLLLSLSDTNQDNDEHPNTHSVAGLSCKRYGGPYSSEAVSEMIYWRDIPQDSKFGSPFKKVDEEQYLTFEPDEGGWNNIRMGLETVVGIAVMTGRTLVLPPSMNFYLLWFGPEKEDNLLGFTDFFHLDSVFEEHVGLKVISFQEFLEREAMEGHLIDPTTNQPSFPPKNQTNWNDGMHNYDASKQGLGKTLWPWLRNVVTPLEWNYDNCVAAFPSEPGKEAADRMLLYLQQVLNPENLSQKPQRLWRKQRKTYDNNPTPVDGNVTSRLNEMLANREDLCVYDERLQNAKVIHGYGEGNTGFRLLIHFYAFLFFENYKHDLWFKRFVRDHFRYIDIVQCAAARVVEKLHSIASTNHYDGDTTYDAMHIRRGDFQYTEMRISAEEIYNNNTINMIRENRTVYVATDEKNASFFDPIREHYNLYFLHDFTNEIGPNVSKNYYGMIDQLVASRSDTFVGVFFSTFTGYINRLRGHHSQKLKSPGYKNGIINSYYYVPHQHRQFRDAMRIYHSVQPAYWQQEYAVGWRDIDHDVEGRITL